MYPFIPYIPISADPLGSPGVWEFVLSSLSPPVVLPVGPAKLRIRGGGGPYSVSNLVRAPFEPVPDPPVEQKWPHRLPKRES